MWNEVKTNIKHDLNSGVIYAVAQKFTNRKQIALVTSAHHRLITLRIFHINSTHLLIPCIMTFYVKLWLPGHAW